MRFSVLMANYNGAKYIKEAINSVINQTFKEWELIIVDDCSTDNSIEIIQPFLTYNHIQLIKNHNNVGYGESLNIAVQHMTSPFLGTLDSDDMLLKDAIEIMYNAHIKYHDASMIYSQFHVCDHNMNFIKIGNCAKINSNDNALNNMCVSHFRTHKLSFLQQTTGFHKSLKKAIDKDIIFKMEEVGQLVYIDQVLYLYRKHDCGISQGSNTKKAKAAKQQAIIEAKERRKSRE